MTLILVEPIEPSEPIGPVIDHRPGQQPRRVRGLTRGEAVEYAIALAGGVHLATLLRFLLDWDDLMGTALIALGAFVVFHYAIVRARSSPDVAIDRAVTTVMWTIGIGIVALLGWVLVYVTAQGISKLGWSFLTEDLATVGPNDPGGGAKHALVGTLEQVGLATIGVVPVSVLTAVYLHEIRGRMSGVIRFIVDALSGLPSIVAGLLVFTMFPGFSGLRASLALFVLALPIVTRTGEEVLRTVPDGLREASLALGAPQWRVVMFVVLPTARAGLVTATLLAIARMVGETAPVLLTAFGNSATNWNPLSGTQSSLPLFVYQLIRLPSERQQDRAWAGALVLLILVLIAFAIARFTLARSDRRLGRR